MVVQPPKFWYLVRCVGTVRTGKRSLEAMRRHVLWTHSPTWRDLSSRNKTTKTGVGRQKELVRKSNVRAVYTCKEYSQEVLPRSTRFSTRIMPSQNERWNIARFYHPRHDHWQTLLFGSGEGKLCRRAPALPRKRSPESKSRMID